MEITTEQGAGSEGAAGAEGAAAAEGTPETPDVSKIIGEFGSRLDGFMERVGGQIETLSQQGAAAGDAGDEGDAGEGEVSLPQYNVADYDEDGLLRDEAQAREMARIAGEIADQRVAGIQSERAAEREARAWEVRDSKAEALESKYPDLADEDKQEHYLQIAKDEAEKLGKPELAIEPDWLERVYLSEKAKETAGDEIPAGGKDGVTLERGGVTATQPGGSEGQNDGDRIVALAKQRRHRI